VFDTVLVANRGEIAVRVVRACHDLGIRAVVAHSTADRGSLAVRLADDAVCVGPAPARQSYLNPAAVLYACARAGADAVHPGYGFLSEDAHFAEACHNVGVAFIGPTVETIRLTGDKLAARRCMDGAGLPVLAGSDRAVADVIEARAVADRIGYPVILKASGGGGGRAISVVHDARLLASAFRDVQRDARRTCLTDDVFVERFVKHARHVEVQILADRHGNVVSLGERDCTIQRRRQKLVEESPSPAVEPELRERLHAMGLAAARAVGYECAGTVELLLDEHGSLSFCEINPRIQVEHTVTEQVTGIDLVTSMIRAAAGEPLPFRQADVAPRGHALQCRINAEDPARGWTASTGRISRFRPPSGPHVRVDTHLHDGCEVGPHYDSLLAKVIVTGADRVEALARMRRALREFELEGVATTLGFHRELLDDQTFCAGEHRLDFVERHCDADGHLLGRAERTGRAAGDVTDRAHA
jgi:acetyl-CoA carboxylase biotin carboxylase subunit